jgi:hypothetical protein
MSESDHHLIAQIIWHVVDGIANNKFDFPVGSKAGYAKYNVTIQDLRTKLCFTKVTVQTDGGWKCRILPNTEVAFSATTWFLVIMRIT